MPVLIDGGPTTRAHSNARYDPPRPVVLPSCDFTPGPPNAFINPSFEVDLAGWQGSAVGWDTTTLSRVFSVPLLFTATPTSGTNGATPTSGESVPDAIDSTLIDGAATLTYSTSSPILGTVSYVASAGGGSNRACIVKGGFSGFDRQFVRAYFNKSTAPAVNQSIIKSYQTTTAGTQALSVRCNTSSKLEIINAANSVVVTTTNSIPIGGDFHVTVDVTASTGAGSLTLYIGKDSDNPVIEVLPFTAGAAAFGSQINTWTFGNTATNNVTGTLKFGGIAISYVDPGSYEVGEVSGNAVAAHAGKWVMKVTFPTGTQAAGCLYKIPAGTYVAGLKKLIQFWVYVPTGNPDVFVRDYGAGTHGPPMTTKDSWQQVSLVITTSASDQYVGVIDGTLPSASHTSGQYFLIDDQTNRAWGNLIRNPSVEETLDNWTPNYFTWDTSTISRVRMGGPELVASYQVVSPDKDQTTLVTQNFTPANGEVLVVKCVSANSTLTPSTPTGGSQTYTSRASDSTASHVAAAIYTAVVSGSPGSMAVSVAWAGGSNNWHSIVVERWLYATLAGTPATNSTKTGSGAPSTTLTTVGYNSVVTTLNGDWAAIAPATPTYRSSAVPDGLHDVSPSDYVAYYFWQRALTPGSQTIGLTAPAGETWTLLGVEILGTVPVTLDGDWAIKCVFPTPTANGYSGVSYFMPVEENLVVGNSYTFAIWVYVPTGQPDVAAQIPFVATGPTVSVKDAWTLATVTGTFTSTTQALGVANASFSSYSAGQFFYADSASLTDNGVALPTGSGFFVLL